MPTYLLDADVFINSHQLHYAMDFCPAFWDWLVSKNAAGRVFSIDRIGDELKQIDDELCGWAKARGEAFSLPVDELTTRHLPQLVAWVQHEARFRDNARAAFFASADIYLIAYAMAHGHVVVTREKSEPESKKKVKIPDVGVVFGVKSVSLPDLLRAEGARFVLSSAGGGGISGFDALKH